MAEENIKITIDDAELDALIEKADEALGKVSDTSVEQDIDALDVELDGLETQLELTEEELDWAETEATSLHNSLMWTDIQAWSSDLPVLSRQTRMILSQIPGLREASNLYSKFRSLTTGSLTLTMIYLTIAAYRELIAYFDRIKKEEEDYRRMINQYRHFTTMHQFEEWEDKQRQAAEQYRSQPTP